MTIWTILLFVALVLWLVVLLRAIRRFRLRVRADEAEGDELPFIRALGTVLTDPAHIGDRRLLAIVTLLVLIAVLGLAYGETRP
jgi:hypothetical protein